MKYRVTLFAEYTCVVEAENEDEAFDEALDRASRRNTIPNWGDNEPEIEEVSD